MKPARAWCNATLTGLLLFSSAALADSARQSMAVYNDNQGFKYYRLGVDGTVNAVHGSSAETAVTLTMNRDIYQREGLIERGDTYNRNIYETGYRKLDSLTIATNSTIGKVNELRTLLSAGFDEAVATRTAGVGYSRWFFHDSIRAGIDVSRTVVDQPYFESVDYDAALVSAPTWLDQTGVDLVVRHLATPTTIVDYSAGTLAQSNRPLTYRGGLTVKQFIIPFSGAVHGRVHRAVNKGEVTTATDYGEVDAWDAELGYLQNLGDSLRGKVGYRYYREDEITRAYRDHRVVGSDTVSVGVLKEFPKGSLTGVNAPLVLEGGYSRYLTNTAVAAHAYEAGVLARF